MTNQEIMNEITDMALERIKLKDRINELEMELSEIKNKQYKDPLVIWREGFKDGSKHYMEMINEMTGQEFKELSDVILFIRKHK
jgi:regulator of replication initiation timing